MGRVRRDFKVITTVLPPRSPVTVTMTVRKEVALDVLDYAKVLVRITSDADADEDQASIYTCEHGTRGTPPSGGGA
tara:strand:- start:48 stop:275 length:228 start_codon:yes stop_codon:yes gene_type:complete